MAEKPGKNTFTQAMKVAAAMHLLGTGRAKTKEDAAEMADIGRSALSPANLMAVAEANPELFQTLRTDILDTVATVDGKTVSLRDGLSRGLTKAVEVIARLGEKLDRLTKEEGTTLKRAKDWLSLCVSLGLFKSPQMQTPGELADKAVDRSGSLEWWMRDHNRRQSRAPAGMLTIRRPGESETVDTEAVTLEPKVVSQPSCPPKSP